MENFRELEKELKRKQYSKKALQHSGKSRRGGASGGGDDDSSDGGDGDSDSDVSDEGSRGDSDYGIDSQIDEEDEGDLEEDNEVEETKSTFKVDQEPEDKPEERRKNSDYLSEVLIFFKNLSSQVEAELEAAKNKKVKGPLYKKQKEKQGAL